MDFIKSITIENGWILTAIFLVVCYVPMFIGGRGTRRLLNFSFASKKAQWLSYTVMILFFASLIIPVFYPISSNVAVRYIGFTLYVIGGIGILISYYNYMTSDPNKLITKGLYKLSRNPIYVFTFIMLAGIAVLCHSYIIGGILVLYFILQHPIIKEEEDFCYHTYGVDYTVYKQHTRRYL